MGQEAKAEWHQGNRCTTALLEDQIQLNRELYSQSYSALSLVTSGHRKWPVLTFNPQNPYKVSTFPPFYKRRNWGTERLVSSRSDTKWQSQNLKQRTFPTGSWLYLWWKPGQCFQSMMVPQSPSLEWYRIILKYNTCLIYRVQSHLRNTESEPLGICILVKFSKI